MDYQNKQLYRISINTKFALTISYLEGSRRELLLAEMKGLLFRSAARKCSQETPTPPSDRWTISIWAKKKYSWLFAYMFDQKRWHCWMVINSFLGMVSWIILYPAFQLGLCEIVNLGGLLPWLSPVHASVDGFAIGVSPRSPGVIPETSPVRLLLITHNLRNLQIRYTL